MIVKQATPLSNPFCSRSIRPGATPFIFPNGKGADAVVDRLRSAGWRGEIVGGHGSGKSSLLATLMPAMIRAGRKVLLVELHDRQRRLPLDLDRQHRREPFDTLVIDGYEQLGRLCRFFLKRRCRQRGWGILATAHASVGFATIYRTAVTPELAIKVIARLLAGHAEPPKECEIRDRLDRHGGNLREVLFDLYDVYEQMRPAQP